MEPPESALSSAPRCPPEVGSARCLAHQISFLLPALEVEVKCSGLRLGNLNGVRLPWAKTASVVPSRACSLRPLHSDCPLDRPLHLTSFWHPEIQVTLASKLSPGLSYNGH